MSSWVIYSLIAAVGATGFTLINRLTLRHQADSTAFAWWFEALRLCLFLLIVPFDFFIDLNLKSLTLFTLLSFSEVVAVYLYMRVHTLSHVSLSSVVFQSRALWVVLFAWIILHERLHVTDYLAILVLVIGTLVTLTPKTLKLGRGVPYAAAFALVSAFSVIFGKMSTPYASPSVLTLIFSFSAFLFLPFLMRAPLSRLKHTFSRHHRDLLLTTLVNGVTQYAIFAALATGPASKVHATISVSSVMVVGAGFLFLKERQDFVRRAIGITITLGAALYLTLN